MTLLSLYDYSLITFVSYRLIGNTGSQAPNTINFRLRSGSQLSPFLFSGSALAPSSLLLNFWLRLRFQLGAEPERSRERS